MPVAPAPTWCRTPPPLRNSSKIRSRLTSKTCWVCSLTHKTSTISSNKVKPSMLARPLSKIVPTSSPKRCNGMQVLIKIATKICWNYRIAVCSSKRTWFPVSSSNCLWATLPLIWRRIITIRVVSTTFRLVAMCLRIYTWERIGWRRWARWTRADLSRRITIIWISFSSRTSSWTVIRTRHSTARTANSVRSRPEARTTSAFSRTSVIGTITVRWGWTRTRSSCRRFCKVHPGSRSHANWFNRPLKISRVISRIPREGRPRISQFTIYSRVMLRRWAWAPLQKVYRLAKTQRYIKKWTKTWICIWP